MRPDSSSLDGIPRDHACLTFGSTARLAVESKIGAHRCYSTSRFLAFDDVAHDLIKHAKKGDQLIVEALVFRSTVVQEYYAMQQVQFVVTAFEFGARARNGGNASSAQVASPPPPPPESAAVAAVV